MDPMVVDDSGSDLGTVCEILDHDDLAYLVIRWMADSRLDEDLTYLRAASRRMREIVDRAWRNRWFQIVDRGLPCPELKRSWRGIVQSVERIREQSAFLEGIPYRDRQRYSVSDMLQYVARNGTVEQMQLLILRTNPSADTLWNAESTMVELGRWDMLELCGLAWHQEHHCDNGQSGVLLVAGIHEALGRGGHLEQIRMLMDKCPEFVIDGRAYSHVATTAAIGAATVGNLDLIRELSPQVIPSYRYRVMWDLANHGHCERFIEFQDECRWYKADMDGTTALDDFLAEHGTYNMVGYLAVRRQWSAAESLLAHGSGHPRLEYLIQRRDLVAARWFLRNWPDHVVPITDVVINAMGRDLVEMVAELLPHSNCNEMEPRAVRDLWGQFILGTTTRMFLRWAPFLYRVYPLDEWDAHQFFDEPMRTLSGTLCTRDALRQYHDKQSAVDWIDEHWTRENKDRVQAMDKWWIQSQE